MALIAITACTWDDYDGQDTLGIRGDLSGNPLPGAFKSNDSVALADENIVAMLALLNGGSILTAKLAETRTDAALVRRLARDVIADHTAQQAEIDSIARSANLTPLPPPEADSARARARSTRAALAALRGRAFDRAFVEWIQTAHRQRLDDLQRYAAMARHPELAAAISNAIATVRSHFERANTISARGSGGGERVRVQLRAA